MLRILLALSILIAPFQIASAICPIHTSSIVSCNPFEYEAPSADFITSSASCCSLDIHQNAAKPNTPDHSHNDTPTPHRHFPAGCIAKCCLPMTYVDIGGVELQPDRTSKPIEPDAETHPSSRHIQPDYPPPRL